MAIEKSLYEAPQGLGSLPESEPEIEIEIMDPESVNIAVGGMEISLESERSSKEDFNANLAEFMDEGELMMVSSELMGDYMDDLNGRRDWLDSYVKGLQLLGLKYEDRTEPWAGACGVNHPLLMESAVKFQSETIMETFPAAGPVRTKIIGKETPEKKEAAVRVEEDMNYELLEVMKEYRPEHERLLISLCLSGNAFKKIYFDPSLDRQVAMFISAEDIVVPYGAPSLEAAERVTHQMRKTKNEVKKLQYAGFYRDVELGEPMTVMDEVERQKAKDQGFASTTDSRYTLLEIHANLDLKDYPDVDKDNNETGIALPYVVTIDKGSGEVLAIRRNWLEGDELKRKRQHFVHYGYIPGFGFYYFGLIHLIGGHAKSATSLLRQLIDAGTLSNLPGGLKAKGLRIKGDDTPISPGEFRDVDLPSGAIRDNILPLPYKEPSQVLAALMDRVVEDGRRFAAVADLKVSDMSAQAPVGTTLAILERVLKVMSAVQARIHYTMKQEFKLLAGIIRDNTPEEYSYEPEMGNKSAKKSDYDMVDVIPVSDPNASTMSQRVVQYQAVLQLAQTAPQIYDLAFLHRQMIDTLGVKNADKIVPTQDDMKPVDPVTENMNILNSRPAKAFLTQDHEAHLQVHISALQNPKMMGMIGQNPQAQTIMGGFHAHIMEHVSFQYRKEIEKQLGVPLPEMDQDEPMDPEVETQVAQLAALASAKLLQKDVAEAQAQQQQQQMQDPLIQMQMQELQIKQAEIQRKAQKDMVEAQAKAQEMQIRQKESAERLQLDKTKVILEAAKSKDEMDARDKTAITKIILDAAAKKDQLDAQREDKNEEKNRLHNQRLDSAAAQLLKSGQSDSSQQVPRPKKGD